MKFCETKFKNLVKLIASGNTIKDSCYIVGIHHQTYYDWVHKAEAGNPKYAELLEHLKKAEAEFKQHHISNVTNAADTGVWQAAAWMLERKYPDEYGRREKVELNYKLAELVKVLSEVDEDTESDN